MLDKLGEIGTQPAPKIRGITLIKQSNSYRLNIFKI